MRVLVACKGGFGDVLPLVAVARELRARGHVPILAAERHHRVLARDLGMAFRVLPGPSGNPFAEVRAEEVRALLPLLDSVDLVLVNPLAPAVVLAARYIKKTWVYASATPMVFASPEDPPWWPGLARSQRLFASCSHAQRAAFRLARFVAARQSRDIAHVAQALGIILPGHPRFEGLYSPAANLLLASPLLSPALPHGPSAIHCLGFCPYIPPSLENIDAQRALEDFVGQGEPPVIIAPGGADRANPRPFVELARAACRDHGLRAVVSARAGSLRQLDPGPDLLILPYLPYPFLFQGARAVIHSGGIGSLSWALRSSIPSIVLPSVWDQFDNARRAVARGYGLWPKRSRRHLYWALQDLVRMESGRLLRDAVALGREDGAKSAADFLAARFSVLT